MADSQVWLLKKVVVTYFKVLFHNLPTDIEEYHEKIGQRRCLP
jgi:hypothetical protein